MDATERQLLDAVLAAPDDDTPRLVYADWLQEREDPRGEFIALQCRPRLFEHAVFERAWRLEREYKAAWLAPLAIVQMKPLHFVRGFVERLELDAADWIRHNAALCAATPVREIQVSNLTSLADVLAAPGTQTLRSVESFRGERLGGRLGGLDRVPALAQLEALQLCEAALVDRDIAELAALKAAPRMLCLDANRFTAFGLRAVLRSALARRLEWISVDYVALGDEVAPLLAELSSLRVVSLAQTNIQGKALRTMVERLTAIEVLRIDSARDLRPSDVAGFAALSRLRALGLGSTGLGDEGVEALCAIASSLPTLRELDLHRCQIESRGAAALARSAFELESLKLYGNCLDQAARDALLEKFGGAVLF